MDVPGFEERGRPGPSEFKAEDTGPRPSPGRRVLSERPDWVTALIRKHDIFLTIRRNTAPRA
jgi:hypothetical protein